MPKIFKSATFAVGLILLGNQAVAEDTSTAEDSSGVDAVVVQLLLESLAHNIEGNIDAAERESGELAKLVRALTGVSVRDIERYGICGGKNSELRKILGDSACGGKAE